jgi:hypothetical protein
MKLYEAIKIDITKGVYPVGSFLPNELQLAEKYGHARDTIRLALALLEDEKIIELKKNKGRQICKDLAAKSEVPISFLLPCPDYLSGKVLSSSFEANRLMLSGLSRVAFAHCRRVETVPVSPTNNPCDIDWSKLNFINSNSLVVVYGEWYRQLFPLLVERGCRVVFIYSHNAYLQEDKQYIEHWHRICFDTFTSTKKLVEYLYGIGCRKIGLFHRAISQYRHPILLGYLAGLEACGLGYCAWHELPEEDMSPQTVKLHLQEFNRVSDGFDSLIIDPWVVLDLRLRNVYYELGLLPEMKIAVSVDILINQFTMPSLTGFSLPYEEVGQTAALQLLNADYVPGEQMVSGVLVERESTCSTNASFASLVSNN